MDCPVLPITSSMLPGPSFAGRDGNPSAVAVILAGVFQKVLQDGCDHDLVDGPPFSAGRAKEISVLLFVRQGRNSELREFAGGQFADSSRSPRVG